MFSSGASNFNRNLEKATSQLLLEPDWDSVLQIVDCIRQGDVNAKTALAGIKKKMSNENPHVSMFALQVLEACVKNCGSSFHTEVATKEFMEFMKDQAKTRADPVKEKILELIQTWSHAFRNEPRFKAVEDTFHVLKMEGHKFPALREADAMFDAEKAPQWKEGETCTRCRVQFSVILRKHHCRNCGEVFCGKCSSKTSTIPKLGFEREVRVCDSCYDKINKSGTSSSKKDDDLPAEYLASPLSKQPQKKKIHVFEQGPPTKSDQEQQEEEELMLALALSKSEHETKEKERERLRSNYGVYGGGNNNERTVAASPPKTTTNPAPLTAIDTADMDPELARYLNRHYWQQKSEEQTQPTTVSTTVPSAPPTVSEARMSTGQTNEAPQVVSSHLYQNGDTDNAQEQFLSALQGSLEIFVNRMRSNSQRGRPIANDSAVQSLFAVISEMHPQLMTHIQEREDARSYYEGLQDKLTQLRDAREALDSLREEHREKRRREAEELERQRQIQMMQKLEVMRQKKHEYLEMQRQLALQRLQEQEREMHARLEHQKQLTHMRQMQAFGYPQGYPGGPGMMGGLPGGGMPPQGGMQAHGYNAGGSAEGSPVHRMAMGADGYGNMQQGVPPHSMAPGQAGMYSMGGAQFPPTSMPPGGYQADGPGMMPQQNYNMQGDMNAVGMNQHVSGPMSMTTAPPNIGTYPSMQTSAAGLPSGPPSMGPGMDSQAGYQSMAPQTSDYQSFNMQGMSAALPSHQGQAGSMYNPQVAPPQGPPGGQHYAAGPPQSGQYQSPPPQQQQQGYMGQQYQPGALPPGQQQQQPAPPQEQKEVQLISFD